MARDGRCETGELWTHERLKGDQSWVRKARRLTPVMVVGRQVWERGLEVKGLERVDEKFLVEGTDHGCNETEVLRACVSKSCEL